MGWLVLCVYYRTIWLEDITLYLSFYWSFYLRFLTFNGHAFRVVCISTIAIMASCRLTVDVPRDFYSQLKTIDERNFAAANSAILLVAYYLVQLGYFLGLSKSIFITSNIVPYLNVQSNLSAQAFSLIAHKKQKFIKLLREILSRFTISVKTLQRFVGQCISFSLAVPAAQLFTSEMNTAISRGLQTHQSTGKNQQLPPAGTGTLAFPLNLGSIASLAV